MKSLRFYLENPLSSPLLSHLRLFINCGVGHILVTRAFFLLILSWMYTNGSAVLGIESRWCVNSKGFHEQVS